MVSTFRGAVAGLASTHAEKAKGILTTERFSKSGPDQGVYAPRPPVEGCLWKEVCAGCRN